jgi:hypothetical protein
MQKMLISNGEFANIQTLILNRLKMQICSACIFPSYKYWKRSWCLVINPLTTQLQKSWQFHNGLPPHAIPSHTITALNYVLNLYMAHLLCCLDPASPSPPGPSLDALTSPHVSHRISGNMSQIKFLLFPAHLHSSFFSGHCSMSLS